ncbi:DUF3017 domain-containing protein [Streptomyces lavendulae]|uniref:DUF3017 domain-containing protein n=1 Tax=Streptomyces lavendulae TaxID=1914 RepID=UPI0025559329|nr:DUF3017 domain-containing protein [Streptomyces lavendulae]
MSGTDGAPPASGPGAGKAPEAGRASGPDGASGSGRAPGSAKASGSGKAPGSGEAPGSGQAPGSGKAPGPGTAAGAGAAGARSRRFPTVTQDTARPEGGGRAIPGAVSTPARQWPMLSVLAATAVGLLTTAVGQARVGCLVIGIALIAAAVMRRALPSVGMLAVRSRFTDMITYGVLGVAITLLALVMEPGPWLHLPFLESAVRFTVR